MSDAVSISIINGAFSLLAVIVGLMIRGNLKIVHKQINSRMDQLLDVNKSNSRAEGKLEGISEQKEEQKLPKKK